MSRGSEVATHLSAPQSVGHILFLGEFRQSFSKTAMKGNSMQTGTDTKVKEQPDEVAASAEAQWREHLSKSLKEDVQTNDEA